MTARRSTKRRPRIVGVIASRADLDRALQMPRPPDLFHSASITWQAWRINCKMHWRSYARP